MSPHKQREVQGIMGNRRPERDLVEQALLQNHKRHAYEIADEIGITETMGYDKAVAYVKSVKKSMRDKGQITFGHFASDHERLQDIETLFENRQGVMSSKAAYMLLLLNCYYRLRSEDDSIHMGAIDDTYRKNAQLEEPLPMYTAIHICEIALAQYKQSIDEKRNASAQKRGLPGAGLNYTDPRFIEKLEITADEFALMKSIQTMP